MYESGFKKEVNKMGYYEQVYSKRLNRYGFDYEARIQRQREQMFDKYLLKTVYRVDILHEGEEIAGSFERYKQDDSETLHYLLTKTNVKLAAGTVLFIPNMFGENVPWMVFYLEEIAASGYNKYVMMKLTHYITWEQEGQKYSSWVYLYGSKRGEATDDAISKMATWYTENDNMATFILPKNPNLKKETYLVIGRDTEYEQAYNVVGIDAISTEGIMYVTIDPVLKRDETPAPTKSVGDTSDDYFWLEGDK